MSKFKQQRAIGEAFRSHDLRATPQRHAVFRYLLEHPVHPTAEEIFCAVNRNDPLSSRATVYNTLHALVAAGLVREVELEGRAARFDANIARHHHFICEACGGVEDVDWFELPPAAAQPRGGRAVRSCDVILRGLCARCNERGENSHA